MIKNVVFDMGGVLVDYDPEKTLRAFFGPEAAEILLKEIFRNQVWSDKDRGIISPREIVEMKRDVVPPEFFDRTAEMINNFYPYMPPFEDARLLVKLLKENGYGLYLLSNASKDFHREKRFIPALREFDGLMISADYGLLKPEKEIYLAFFDRFSLKPGECFFIDDSPENVEGAKAVGMDGFCYKSGNVEFLKKVLKDVGIKI